jgi:hypothetical protein
LVLVSPETGYGLSPGAEEKIAVSSIYGVYVVSDTSTTFAWFAS